MHIDNRRFEDLKPNVLEVARSSIGMSAYKGVALHTTHNTQAGSFVYQESFSAPPQKVVVDSVNAPGRVQGEMVQFPNFSVPQMGMNQIYTSANVSYNRPLVSSSVVVDNGTTIVYVSDLNWWTTDADLEHVLSCYGRVKEIKFFDERVSGKSKGYCEVEFYESAAASACKLGMDGHPFNGRPCVVSFSNPHSVKHTSSSQMNKTHVQAPPQAQGRKPGIDTAAAGIRGNGLNYPIGDAGRNLGRGSHVMLNKGPVVGLARGSGGLVRPSNGGVTSAGPYGQGFGGLIHPQTMMAPGIDPAYMGRGIGYGSFTAPSFPGMMAPFPVVNPMGVLPGTVPLVNPFFPRGMPPNVMMRPAGNEGPQPFMWTDTSVVGYEGEEHGGDDNTSEYGYGQSKEVKTGSVSRAKEWGIENADEREPDGERHDGGYRYKEENDSYYDNQQKERDSGYRNDFDREQDYDKSRSSYSDYPKRRRQSE